MYKPWERLSIGTGYGVVTPKTWAITAVAGGTAIAGITGAYMASDATSSAGDAAASATRDATAMQVAESQRQYDQTRSDFEPYRNLAPESLATLESSIYGRPIEYTDSQGNKVTASGQQFDLANFKPEDSAAYDWQESKTLEDLGNYFNLTGRGRGSTVQSNSTTNALGSLNASEYENGYNRLYNQKQDYQNSLLNLIKTAQGAASSTSAAGTAASNQTTSAYQNEGNTLSNIATTEGQTTANLYAGIVPSLMNTASTGVQLSNYYSSPDLTDPFGTNWGQ